MASLTVRPTRRLVHDPGIDNADDQVGLGWVRTVGKRDTLDGQ